MDYTPPPAVIFHQPAPQSTNVSSPEAMTRLLAHARSAKAALPDERAKYTFRAAWFEGNRPDWEELTAPLLGKRVDILEIGSFEGCSTTWMMDNLLDDADSTMTAVDTFEGSIEHTEPGYELETLEQRFLNNVTQSKNATKLRILKGMSADRLIQLRTEKASFDLIYIDGSHTAEDVLQDATLAWPMLKENGLLVFDDYNWGVFEQPVYAPRMAITSFLSCVSPTVRWYERHGQVWAQKVSNYDPPRSLLHDEPVTTQSFPQRSTLR